MKKLFIILIIGAFLGACSEEKVGVYSLEDDYIYIPYNSNIYGTVTSPDSAYMFYNKASLFVNSKQQRDTFYFRVLVVGEAQSVDRKIKLEPYVYKVNGTEEAVAGVNYVAFDDPEMQENLIVAADSLGANIPIIVTYDPAIAGVTKSFIVAFKLAESEDFKVFGVNSDLTAGNSARIHAYVQFNQSSL